MKKFLVFLLTILIFNSTIKPIISMDRSDCMWLSLAAYNLIEGKHQEKFIGSAVKTSLALFAGNLIFKKFFEKSKDVNNKITKSDKEESFWAKFNTHNLSKYAVAGSGSVLVLLLLYDKLSNG